MNNKKVILVIILFIGISFIVYSFANPLTEEENLNGNGMNTGISEGNNSGNNSMVDDDHLDDDNLEENKEPEEENNNLDEAENDDSTNQIVQNKPSNNSQSQVKPKPTTPKYYCRVVSGKYYGSSGNTVNYANFVSQCDSSNPTFTLATTFDGPYAVKLGTSKKLSDFYNSPSFGVLGGSVTCKNGNSVITNLNEIKTAGVYTITCTATGGNGKSTSVSIPVRVKPLFNMTPTLGTFTRTNYIYGASVVPDDAKIVLGDLNVKVSNGKAIVTNNLKVSQTGNKIYVTGSMLAQTKDVALNSNKYISLNYIGERQYTKEEISKAKFYINKLEYHPTIGTATNGNSYVSFKRNFRKGDSFNVSIDWGDGNGRYDYEVHYDVDVFTIDEIISSIEEQLGVTDIDN